MSQLPAKLKKLRAELETVRGSAIEAHRKLWDERRASDDNKAILRYAQEKLAPVREDLRKTLEMLDAQKVKLAKSQAALEMAKWSAAESQYALLKAEERLEEVRADRKAICESNIELKEQVKLCKSEMESEREALSQAREGSESLQKALDESLEREAEATKRLKLLEAELEGIPLVLSFLLSLLVC